MPSTASPRYSSRSFDSRKPSIAVAFDADVCLSASLYNPRFDGRSPIMCAIDRRRFVRGSALPDRDRNQSSGLNRLRGSVSCKGSAWFTENYNSIVSTKSECIAHHRGQLPLLRLVWRQVKARIDFRVRRYQVDRWRYQLVL